MDTQTAIANAVSIVGGFAAIGALFDQILMSEHTRKRIRNFIKEKRVIKRSPVMFFDYISIINASVFSRFFSARFFSFNYFLSCSVISGLSLALILTFQYFVLGGETIRQLELTHLQVWILALCVLFNFIIDWISIGQTQVFFSISEEQKSVPRAILLIASDFILTVNLFALIYALVVGLVVSYFLMLPERVQINAWVTTGEVTSTDRRLGALNAPGIFGPNTNLVRSTFYLEAGRAGADARNIGPITTISNTPEFNLADVLSLSATRLIAVVDQQSNYFILRPDSRNSSGIRKSYAARGSREWKELSSQSGAKEYQEARLEIPQSGIFFHADSAYSAAYILIDGLQDGFPASVLEPASFISLSSLLSSYFSYLSHTKAETVFACGAALGDKVVWVRRTEVELSSCEKKLVFGMDDIDSIMGRLKSRQGEVVDLKVPLNSLFLTSLSVTALLYSACVFLFLSRQLFHRAVAGVRTVEVYFLRSPFACVGLLVGMLAYGLSLIF